MMTRLKEIGRAFARRLYWSITIGFGLALAWAFGLRGLVPVTWKAIGDPASFAFITAWVGVNAVLVYHRHFRFRDLQMEQVDAMAGDEFEQFCAYLLRRNGYKRIQVTRASGDQGIDIIARKKGTLVGFQCKRYTGFVGNKAVQEAWTGHNFYQCDAAAVMTNSEFSDSAKEVAEELGVRLIDRARLRRMMRRLPS